MVTDISRRPLDTSASGVDTLIERIADRLSVTVKASTIYGEPVERDGLTVIPVARARWGFGGGGGSGQEERGPRGGGGGGGGMTITPAGFIEIGHGQSAFKPIRDPRAFLPYVVGASALLMLSLRLLGRRSSHARTFWKGLRR